MYQRATVGKNVSTNVGTNVGTHIIIISHALSGHRVRTVLQLLLAHWTLLDTAHWDGARDATPLPGNRACAALAIVDHVPSPRPALASPPLQGLSSADLVMMAGSKTHRYSDWRIASTLAVGRQGSRPLRYSSRSGPNPLTLSVFAAATRPTDRPDRVTAGFLPPPGRRARVQRARVVCVRPRWEMAGRSAHHRLANSVAAVEGFARQSVTSAAAVACWESVTLAVAVPGAAYPAMAGCVRRWASVEVAVACSSLSSSSVRFEH